MKNCIICAGKGVTDEAKTCPDCGEASFANVIAKKPETEKVNEAPDAE